MRLSPVRLCFVVITLLGSLGCATGHDPAALDQPSEDALERGGLRRSNLPRGTFRTRAEEIAQEWLDGNIMSGDALLDAGTVAGTLSKESLSKFALKMATDRLRRQDQPYEGMDTETPRFTDALIEEAARAIALDGLLYADNARNVDPIRANVRELVGFLGDTAKLDVVKVTGKALNDGPWRVTELLFLNRDTKSYVAFYACQGPT